MKMNVLNLEHRSSNTSVTATTTNYRWGSARAKLLGQARAGEGWAMKGAARAFVQCVMQSRTGASAFSAILDVGSLVPSRPGEF